MLFEANLKFWILDLLLLLLVVAPDWDLWKTCDLPFRPVGPNGPVPAIALRQRLLDLHRRTLHLDEFFVGTVGGSLGGDCGLQEKHLKMTQMCFFLRNSEGC